MRPLRLWLWVGIAALSLLVSCSNDDPAGLDPAPGHYTLSGRVTLTGYLVNDQGTFAGTRVVPDADGVSVELLAGQSVAARTLTTDGVYSFSGLPPAAYQTRTSVIPSVSDLSAVFTIVASNLTAGDTLRLVSRGDLLPIPNPVEDETIIYWEIPDTLEVDIQVMSLAGDTVKTLLHGERNPGINQVRWDGLDRYDNPVPEGSYWVTFKSGSDQRAQLLFKQDPVLNLRALDAREVRSRWRSP